MPRVRQNDPTTEERGKSLFIDFQGILKLKKIDNKRFLMFKNEKAEEATEALNSEDEMILSNLAKRQSFRKKVSSVRS